LQGSLVDQYSHSSTSQDLASACLAPAQISPPSIVFVGVTSVSHGLHMIYVCIYVVLLLDIRNYISTAKLVHQKELKWLDSICSNVEIADFIPSSEFNIEGSKSVTAVEVAAVSH